MEGAYKLNTADFSHNFLQNLPFDLFQKNHIMTHIDLSNNQIRVVPPRLLLGLNVLEEINFSHNLISLVLSKNFSISRLRITYVLSRPSVNRSPQYRCVGPTFKTIKVLSTNFYSKIVHRCESWIFRIIIF